GDFRLANEHDLEQFFLVGLQVGQIAQAFERFIAQFLRLVDQKRDRPPGAQFRDEVIVQLLNHVEPVFFFLREAEVLNHQLGQAVRGEMTIGDKNELNATLQMTHELTQKDRFASTDLAGDEHKSFLGFNSVDQHGQAFGIKWVIVKKTRVGRYAER